MKFVSNLKKLYYTKNIGLYIAIAGPLLMGTVHLISAMKQFSWLAVNYSLFFYLLALIHALLVVLARSKYKHGLYLAGAVSLCVLIIPMTVVMVKTIMEKDAPIYIFFWMIYLYALYGTVKFILAVISCTRARKTGNAYLSVTSWISLVTAAYTIQMMEIALIAVFDTEKSRIMITLQYFTQGAVIAFTVYVIGRFLAAHIMQRKQG